MKAIFLAIFLSLCSLLLADPFYESFSGMQVEIPQSFQPSEQSTYDASCPCWYSFVNADGDILTLEIEEYDEKKSLTKYFHEAWPEYDHLMNEGLAFRQVKLGDIEFTKLTVRVLNLTEEGQRHSFSVITCLSTTTLALRLAC
jgi:hypothetical protein